MQNFAPSLPKPPAMLTTRGDARKSRRAGGGGLLLSPTQYSHIGSTRSGALLPFPRPVLAARQLARPACRACLCLPARRQAGPGAGRPAGAQCRVTRPHHRRHAMAWRARGPGATALRQACRGRRLPLLPSPYGRGSRRRPERSASAVEGRPGMHPEARGGVSGPPHPPLSPQGERETRTRIAREDDRSGGTARGHGKAIRAGARMALLNGRARPDCAWRERRARPRAHLRWRAPRSPA